MKIKLSFKIFIAFSATYILSGALMITIMHFYATWHIASYMDKLIMDNLDNLVNSLATLYQKNSSWDKIRESDEAWQELVISSLSLSPFMHRFPKEPDSEELPEESSAIKEFKGAGQMRPEGSSMPQERSFPPPRPSDIKYHILERLSLFDAQGNYLAGNFFAPDFKMYKNIIVNNEIVGRIGLQKSRQTLITPDISFFNHQLKMFSTIASGTLVFCALVSYLLANHLIAPVRRLIKGTHALTNLRFDTRIEVFSRDELGQLAQDFNLMAKTLERYEQMQRQWISDIAHELRTPLSIMRGEIEAMQDGIRKYSPEMLDSLHDEVMSLAKTVGDLHELSLADTGALHFEQKPVAPVAILKFTLDQFHTRFNQHQISVDLRINDSSEELILGDGRRLRQLFSNIFENSIQHGNSPGTLTVQKKQTGKKLIIFIEDSGPGVPQQSLERIFDRLYRVDFSRNRSGEGSGLGLSICKMIVDAHNGSMKAENGSKGGLRIIISFPIESPLEDSESKKTNII